MEGGRELEEVLETKLINVISILTMQTYKKLHAPRASLMLVFILMLASMPTSIALTIVPAHKQERQTRKI